MMLTKNINFRENMDKRIVQAADVRFDERAPEPDTAIAAAPVPQQPVTANENYAQLMEEYVVNVGNYVQSLNMNTIPYDARKIIPFKHALRFTKELGVRMANMTLRAMVKSLPCKDDAEYVLSNSDISALVYDDLPFDQHSALVQDMFAVREYAMHFERMKETSGHAFNTNSLDYISLFVKDGETLRAFKNYAQQPRTKLIFVNDKFDNLTLELDLSTPASLFSLAAVKEFVKQTGNSKISEMILDYELLYTMLYQSRDTNREKITALFDRLQKYSPQLVYKDTELIQ
jgi:hypothetical protein